MLSQTTALVYLIAKSFFISRGFCIVTVELNGTHITDIPRDLRQDVMFLKIFKTSIRILNMTAASDYPSMYRIEVSTSPIISIITPSPSQSISLTNVALRSGTFSSPPDLGILLSGQLRFLTIAGLGFVAIPDNHFQHYSRLKSLDLSKNPITDLNASSLTGLSQLEHLYLGHTQVNPMPHLHIWLPNLQRLHAPYTGITVIPSSFLQSLPELQYLDFQGNQLTLVPRQEHFINLQNMVFIKIGRNPLQCDIRMCWIKVFYITFPLFWFTLFSIGHYYTQSLGFSTPIVLLI